MTSSLSQPLRAFQNFKTNQILLSDWSFWMLMRLSAEATSNKTNWHQWSVGSWPWRNVQERKSWWLFSRPTRAYTIFTAEFLQPSFVDSPSLLLLFPGRTWKLTGWQSIFSTPPTCTWCKCYHQGRSIATWIPHQSCLGGCFRKLLEEHARSCGTWTNLDNFECWRFTAVSAIRICNY